MRGTKLTLALALIAGVATPVYAASPSPLSGVLIGQVKNANGIAQMGATVVLLDRFDQIIRRSITDASGRFGFDGLSPESYGIRVSLASFVPALRRNIAVRAGAASILDINLTSLFSTVELVYSGAGRGTLMSDDWKWVLRSSQATRPVLRFAPEISSSKQNFAMFSNTRGLLRVSAGDGQSLAGATQQDLGTAFALATSLYGANRLQFAGNLGYSSASGIPTAGFRSTFQRRGSTSGVSPEVSLTMRQLYLPMRAGMGVLSGQPDGAPALRTMSLGAMDQVRLLDQLNLEYGFSLESVSFLDRLNFVSPFARLTYGSKHGMLRMAYSSGTQPTELLARDGEGDAELAHDLSALGLLPRVSLRDGRAHVQRTQNMEIGVQRTEGSRTYSMGLYSESVSNAAFTMSAPVGFLPDRDLLPDLTSSSSVFNVGSFRRTGYSASVTQELGENFGVSLAAGRGGALVADSHTLSTHDASDLRRMIHKAQRGWVTARASAQLPGTGTRLATSYGWTDFRSLMPAHVFLTQRSAQEIGWNISVRQPLPGALGMPGRLEATAELRNMLAQGYLSVNDNEHRKALLIHTPRAVRGGLAFIF
jgi:hypothetical protein